MSEGFNGPLSSFLSVILPIGFIFLFLIWFTVAKLPGLDAQTQGVLAQLRVRVEDGRRYDNQKGIAKSRPRFYEIWVIGDNGGLGQQYNTYTKDSTVDDMKPVSCACKFSYDRVNVTTLIRMPEEAYLPRRQHSVLSPGLLLASTLISTCFLEESPSADAEQQDRQAGLRTGIKTEEDSLVPKSMV